MVSSSMMSQAYFGFNLTLFLSAFLICLASPPGQGQGANGVNPLEFHRECEGRRMINFYIVYGF